MKNLIPHYNSFFITRKLFFYGVLTSLPIYFLMPGERHLALLFDLSHPEFLMNFAFLVVMCSLVAYLLWNESMKILGSITANNYLYGQPIVTLIIAAIILNEPFTILGALGCVFIVGGLVISDKIPELRISRR